MKIGIDIRCLSGGRRTGVEEYVLNLLPEIFAINKKDEFILFFNSFKKNSLDLDWIKKYPNVKLRCFRFPNKLLNFLLWYLKYPKIDKLLGGVDYFFMPNISFVALSKETKLILTIHDLSFERFPNFFSFKRRGWHLFLNPKKLAEQAYQLIAISQSTKEDLETLYGIKTEKIAVIQSGIANKFSPLDRNNPQLIKIKEWYQLPYKFILYFGTKEPRKNLVSLVMAFNQLKEKAQKENIASIKNMQLVLAGASGWLSEDIEKAIFNSPFKKEIKLIHFIKEEEKVFLYNLASFFVYPSFLEGFGFPPLEAQACGIPVIVSANSSFPEILKDSVIMIDPDRPEEISSALEELSMNQKMREVLIQKGKINASNFSWLKTAEKLADNFKK